MLYNSFIGKYSLSNKFGYTKTPSINYNHIYIYESYNLNDRSLKFGVHFFLPFINWSGECQRFGCTIVDGSHDLMSLAGLGLVAICWIDGL